MILETWLPFKKEKVISVEDFFGNCGDSLNVVQNILQPVPQDSTDT